MRQTFVHRVIINLSCVWGEFPIILKFIKIFIELILCIVESIENANQTAEDILCTTIFQVASVITVERVFWSSSLQSDQSFVTTTCHMSLLTEIRSYTKLPELPQYLISCWHQCKNNITRVFCPRAGPSLQVQEERLQFCPKAGLLSQTQEPKAAVLPGMNRCGRFPLLSAPHSLFSIWTDLKRSEKIPGHQRGDEESGFG